MRCFFKLAAADDPEAKTALLQKLAQALLGSYSPAPNPTQRFTQAVSFLDRHGYRARWEAHLRGPRILLRNCPYAALLPQHPELCDLDANLLQSLLHMPVTQVTRVDLNSGQPPACIFTCHQLAERSLSTQP